MGYSLTGIILKNFEKENINSLSDEFDWGLNFDSKQLYWDAISNRPSYTCDVLQTELGTLILTDLNLLSDLKSFKNYSSEFFYFLIQETSMSFMYEWYKNKRRTRLFMETNGKVIQNKGKLYPIENTTDDSMLRISLISNELLGNSIFQIPEGAILDRYTLKIKRTNFDPDLISIDEIVNSFNVSLNIKASNLFELSRRYTKINIDPTPRDQIQEYRPLNHIIRKNLLYNLKGSVKCIENHKLIMKSRKLVPSIKNPSDSEIIYFDVDGKITGTSLTTIKKSNKYLILSSGNGAISEYYYNNGILIKRIEKWPNQDFKIYDYKLEKLGADIKKSLNNETWIYRNSRLIKYINRTNNLEGIIEYHENGKISTYVELLSTEKNFKKWNEKGQLIFKEEQKFDNDQLISKSKTESIYNNQGLLALIRTSTVDNYGVTGNIKKYSYTSSLQIKEIHSAYYNEEKHEYVNYWLSTNCEYNEYNDPIQQGSSHFKYLEYDEIGNWLVRDLIYSKRRVGQEHRKITYYEN